MLPGSRTNIHNIIRSKHGILVMLHDNQRISQIPQMLQSGKQLVIVPLVQSNARFIQNIGYTNQTGTDLSRQTNSLCFPTGQAACRP